MKEFGKMGAAAALVPMVAAGEQMSDKPVGLQRPGFIKQVDQPTTEVDWTQVKRIAEGEVTARRSFTTYIGKERADKLAEIQKANMDKYLKEGRDGYTLKDFALQSASGVGGVSRKYFQDPEDIRSPEKLGVPKYSGSPEEAAMIVAAAARHLGAASVGFVELDTNTTEKLIYAKDPDGKEMRIQDADAPEEGEDYRVIPKKARYCIVYTVQMSEEAMIRCPTHLGAQTTSLTYSRSENIQERLQYFLGGLGYMALGESSTNALGIAPAFGVMAGLGELSRYNRLLTPEYGSMVRVFKMLTDLPLAPTKPINAGLLEYCKNCTKCADHCPSKALSFEKEPTWEVRGGWNNPGHKAWFEDSIKCRSYWYETGNNCGICFAVCPFASKNLASFDKVRNYLAATVPAFDGTLKKIDDLLYTPYTEFGKPQKTAESWWRMNLPDYGISTDQSVRMTS
ncbi:MAG: reductive dehalogenase [Chloroflexota bacterium]